MSVLPDTARHDFEPGPAARGTTGRDRRRYLALKRGFDIVFAACVLIATAPLILLAAAAVRLSSPGPAFYRARRAGAGGQPFDMLKLRTMRVGLDSRDRRVTAENDDRITPIGRVLRACKLDELPQFWNVLRGDMSVVGPRPEDWDIVQRHYTPELRRVLDARPGIASPVDVHWYPDMTYHDPPPDGVPIQDWYLRRHLPVQVAEGVRYVERQSLLLDARVIVMTLYCVVAYSLVPPPRRRLPAERDHDDIFAAETPR